jgi:hypothetical protein
MQLASERLNMHNCFKTLKRGHIRHNIRWEDGTVIDILDEAEFEVTDGRRNNVLQRRSLEKM